MLVFENEQVICCDIDDTIVLWGSQDGEPVTIPCPHTDLEYELVKHGPHVQLMRNRLGRGALLIVWSANGWEWAQTVLTKLGFDKNMNVHVYSKPIAHIDDKDASEWMGPRLYIPPTAAWGRGKKRE